MTSKKTIQKQIVLLLWSALLTSATWVGFEVYRAFSSKSVSIEYEKYIGSFDSSLDTIVIDKLESRNE